MNTPRLAITEEGQVYRLRYHDRPLLLGHISCLAREETPLGREVRAWWQARLASDDEMETLVVAGCEEEPHFVPVHEAVLAVQSQPDREMAEELAGALAADR